MFNAKSLIHAAILFLLMLHNWSHAYKPHNDPGDCSKQRMMRLAKRSCAHFKRSTTFFIPRKQELITMEDLFTADDEENEILMGFMKTAAAERDNSNENPTTTTTTRHPYKQQLRIRRTREDSFALLLQQCCYEQECTMEKFPNLSQFCTAD